MSDRIASILPDFGDFTAGAAPDTDVRKPVPAVEPPAPVSEPPAPEDTPSAESIADRSRRRVSETLGETLRKYRQQAESAPSDAEPAGVGVDPAEPNPDEREPAEDAPAEAMPAGDTSDEETPSADALTPETPTKPPHPRFTMGEDGIITLIYDTDKPESESESEPEPEPEPEPEADNARSGKDTEPPEDNTPSSAEAEAKPRARRERPSGRAAVSPSELLLSPFIRIAASRVARRREQDREAARWPEPSKASEAPELKPRMAARYYAKRAKRIRPRCRVALSLTLVLAWIALGLPMAGRLGQSAALQSGVSLILLLLVMLTAIDVFTAGLRQMFDLAPGPEALASMSALVACVDAALVLHGYGQSQPFCAVCAAALTAGLWGSRLRCLALMRSCRAAAASREPGVVTSSLPRDNAPARLFRESGRDIEGFVRRSEGTDPCRAAYGVAAPIILAAAFVLSVIASLGGKGGNFLHTLSALLSAGASFAAFFGFTLPYAVAARRLRDSGAALAGGAGCAELAGAKELVVTDEDLFPPGTMRFSSINILEGVPQQKVIIAACSLIFASAGGTVHLFEELAARRGCHVPEPRRYSLHESGGVTGIVNGENVDVGPARYMNLQGIRLPQNLVSKNAVCVAIGGELVGVFEIEYTPTTSVQEALVTLLRGRTPPIFAVRDFNIMPKMLRDLFMLPSSNFNFPPYRDRVRLAPDPGRPVSAVISRRGMLPYAEAAEAGRRLHRTARLATILSLIGSAVGMAILFLLCRTGAFETASVGNALLFMTLWALPAAILSYGRGK